MTGRKLSAKPLSSMIILAVFLTLLTAYSQEPQRSENDMQFNGYALPEQEKNAVVYECEAYYQSDDMSWTLTRIAFKLWLKGNMGVLEIDKPKSIASSSDLSATITRNVNDAVVTFNWQPHGYDSPPKFELPDDINDATRHTIDQVGQFFVLIFRIFPENAKLEAGVTWGDENLQDSLKHFNSKAEVEQWELANRTKFMGSRCEFLITGHKIDAYVDATGERHISSRYEIYHFDATAKRNSRVVQDYIWEKQILEDGRPRYWDQEHIVIYEITKPKKAGSHAPYRKPPTE